MPTSSRLGFEVPRSKIESLCSDSFRCLSFTGSPTAHISAMAHVHCEAYKPSAANPNTSTASSSHRHSSKTQDAYHYRLARRDSGYESTSFLSKSPQHRSRSSATSESTPSTPLRRPINRSSTSITPLRSTSEMPESRTSSPPAPSHRTQSSRPSSLARSTRNRSCRSSFLVQPLHQAPIQRPVISRRAVTTGNIHLLENPFLPRPNTASTPQSSTFPLSDQDNRSPSLPTPTPHHQPTYSNFFPATTIDWTLPSTRRKDYSEIDRSCRGIRGLWRKVTPRFCRRNQYVDFFTGENKEDQSDAGSVRRYRLDLKDEDEDEDSDGSGDDDLGKEKVETTKPSLGHERKRATSRWRCWGNERGGK